MMRTIVLLALGVALTHAATFTKTNDCRCGQDNAARIVGGENTGIHEYPWQVVLELDGSLCGGSLINDRYVLTAAHCTSGVSASDITVTLAEHNLGTGSETSKTITRGVSKIIDHSGYSDSTLQNDISLLKLDDTVPISSEILPVCLPPPSNPNPTYAGKSATVTGWGTTSSNGDISNILKEVVVPVISNSKCEEVYGKGSAGITENQLCAGRSGKDSCQGDSGGPLTFIDGGGNHDQIGVVSYGEGCGLDGIPGVYTRVSKYRNWIANNTQDATYCRGFK